ncbi:HesA/MoeB/ThiF family protein [Pseudomonas nunensis]|uniref:ThiF family adenylyltransferase n=1 Tax=Pseudomonas nunensis TaxID=2961896 RepID=A0ABY5ENU3_9PSED|nr:ThiF family adenylyltransferase [Pseudomonas nunensis]MCL5227406.1 ThiF family adenylyltransferase [Pseudomonas nunensis]UTO17389.1 ThiF family adenylyltransferase [Pseudomonas nunensis]
MSSDRYQRHSLIDWFSQEDVKAATFAIVGCGAVGNEVAKNLALLGVGNVDLYDFDTIELHNLTRSVLFREGDVGSFKAEVAAARIEELDPNINVGFFLGDFWDEMSLDRAASYSCIICCVDNFEARIRLNQLCLIAKTNLINTGIDSRFCQVEVFPFASTTRVACYECNLPNSAYERMQARYSCGWLKKISFVEKKIPTTIITSSLTGALAVSNALDMTRGVALDESKRILIDSFSGRSTLSSIESSCSCPACALLVGRVSVLKGGSQIHSSLGFPAGDSDDYVVTSDPVLVSTRCVVCSPSIDDFDIIFQRASSYDASINTCVRCGIDSVQVVIKDSFSLHELNHDFYGMQFPCKFIRMCVNEQTTIIEME